jgi:hypothetical protein
MKRDGQDLPKPDRPAWLRPAPYSEVRLSKDKAAEWLLRLRDQFASPVFGPLLAEMNSAIDTAMTIRRERLATMDWTSWDIWNLAAAVDASLQVERAAEQFLPADWRPYVAPDTQAFLFRQVFVVAAVARAIDDPLEPFDDPKQLITLPTNVRVLLPAARMEFARLTASAVCAEVRSRGGPRRGFSAAVLWYLMRADGVDSPMAQRLAPEASVAEMLDRLALDVGVPARVWAKSALNVPDQADREALTRSQLWETLTRTGPSWSAPEILARGVEGALDLLPASAGYDLRDQARTEIRRLSTPTGERAPTRERPDKKNRAREPLVYLDESAREESITIRFEQQQDASLELLETRALYGEFVALFPRHQEWLDYYLRGAKLKPIAEAKGVSLPAVSKRITAARKAFSVFARRKGWAS